MKASFPNVALETHLRVIYQGKRTALINYAGANGLLWMTAARPTGFCRYTRQSAVQFRKDKYKVIILHQCGVCRLRLCFDTHHWLQSFSRMSVRQKKRSCKIINVVLLSSLFVDEILKFALRNIEWYCQAYVVDCT